MARANSFSSDIDRVAAPTQAEQVPPQLLNSIEEAITRYPVSQRSASLPLLHLWQNHFGYIDESGIEWIATKLGLQPINILELVTFYPWFRQQGAGRIIIRVCHTLSCAMAGSEEIHKAFCKAANIPFPQEGEKLLSAEEEPESPFLTSTDGKFSIEFVECLASCGTAPVCLIQEDLVEKISPGKIPEILDEYVKHLPTEKREP